MFMSKHKDPHILDWSLIIKENAESSFAKPISTPNRGIIFEDLIEELLVAMYPEEVWRRTAKSHDGKKDFVYPEDEYLPDQKWAECKNYQSNVSLNIIAPTLIMGAIENIGTILFFSYSPLNDNAIEGIVRYAESTKKNVKIYDGKLLESIICKYSHSAGVSAFFPTTDFNCVQELLKHEQPRIIKSIRDINGNKLSPSHLFELGEPFFVHVIVQNQSFAEINYRIEASKATAAQLYTGTPRINCSLPSAAINAHTISCQTIRPGNIRVTAKLKTVANGIEKKTENIINKTIRVSDEPYLFWSGTQALDALRTADEHLSTYCESPLFITAQSGVGKSTLIHLLLADNKICRKYSILTFDLNLSRNAYVKNILSQILGVCGPESVPVEQEHDANEALVLLTSNYIESAEQLARIIMEFYDPQRPFLFVIDDIQKMGRSYISLLQELDSHSKKLSYPIYFLFALNESVSSMEDILSRLNWDHAYQNREYEAITLSEFSRNDIVAFIQHKYGLKNISYFFENFDGTIRPIELHSFCTALKQKHIIVPINASTDRPRVYQIVNDFRFAEAVNTILYSNQSLDTVCTAFGGDDTAAYVLKYLYITDDITPKIRTKYSGVITYLISLGILKELNGKLVFRHEEIRRQAEKKLSFSDEDYIDIYCDSSENLVAKAICALNLMNKLHDGPSYLKSFFRLDLNIEKVHQQYELCRLVFTHLGNLAQFRLVPDALHFVMFNFELLDREQGYVMSLQFLKHAGNAAQSTLWDVDESSVETIAFFFKKFFDRSISTHNYTDCLSLFPSYQKNLQKAQHISDKRRNYWMAHYMNRMAIILDRRSSPLVHDASQTEDCYRASEDYCKKAGSPSDLVLQLCIDEFNRHYVYGHDLTKECIAKTYEKLDYMKQSKVISGISLNYHHLLLEYLKIQHHQLPWKPEEFLYRVQTTQKICTSPFYMLKLLLLESYILIELERLAAAKDTLVSARKLAYKRELRHYIYKITYIEGWLHVFEANGQIIPTAYESFVSAFAQIMDAYSSSPSGLKREIFIVTKLINIIYPKDPELIQSFVKNQSDSLQKLLEDICQRVSQPAESSTSFLQMRSYFVYNDVDLPTI